MHLSLFLILSKFLFVSVLISLSSGLCVLVAQVRSLVIKCLPWKQEFKNFHEWLPFSDLSNFRFMIAVLTLQAYVLHTFLTCLAFIRNTAVSMSAFWQTNSQPVLFSSWRQGASRYQDHFNQIHHLEGRPVHPHRYCGHLRWTVLHFTSPFSVSLHLNDLCVYFVFRRICVRYQAHWSCARSQSCQSRQKEHAVFCKHFTSCFGSGNMCQVYISSVNSWIISVYPALVLSGEWRYTVGYNKT